ncbi:MAG: type 2 isopentenyl-diphosphate Delta-isomerase [Candidatus Electryonea clarkiae]|nr:type 2 isopentenyl-diphosphate Delta-isomerase [Candidatus Electryonea clarkiae]MDP8288798.1 type 2 isopentenyl-diphosphate Delta-isomerase [Candidatus Electryonea clarkiae]
MRDLDIVRRKADHLRIVAEGEVEHREGTLLDEIHLVHQALPEIDLDDIDTTTEFFGKTLKHPFMITSMTGGADYAENLNRAIAEAGARLGIAVALGSQRVMLEHPELSSDFQVRNYIPDGVLLGNIGAVQLKEYSPDQIAEVTKQIEADGMCVHLNPAQEIVHGEKGQQDYSGLLDAIARLIDRMNGQVLVKETGAGISPETIVKLKSIGVPYIDVSGSGGTSWTRVEAYRTTDKLHEKLGMTFADWGIPTAFCTLAARSICKESVCIISSGGLRNGLDAARSIAAGANVAGFARPVLLAFLEKGAERITSWFEEVIAEYRSAMFLSGARNNEELHRVPRMYTGKLLEWLNSYEIYDRVKV